MKANRRENPFWLDYKVQTQTKHDMNFKAGRERTRHLREANKTLQTEQKIWKILIDIKDVERKIADTEKIRKEKIIATKTVEGWLTEFAEKKRQKEKEFISECKKKYEGGQKFAYLPGPCGELPVHSCLLLGLKDLTKRLVDELYSPSAAILGSDLQHTVNLAYVSDFDAWFKFSKVRSLSLHKTYPRLLIVNE